jgi:flavorubredoxin
VSELPQIDILFTGASIYAGGISGAIRKFLKNLDQKQAAKVVVFGSSVSGKSALAEIKSILEPKGIPVSEEAFQCKGSFLGFCRGHPDADDLARAEDFAKRICAEKI